MHVGDHYNLVKRIQGSAHLPTPHLPKTADPCHFQWIIGDLPV